MELRKVVSMEKESKASRNEKNRFGMPKIKFTKTPLTLGYKGKLNSELIFNFCLKQRLNIFSIFSIPLSNNDTSYKGKDTSYSYVRLIKIYLM